MNDRDLIRRAAHLTGDCFLRVMANADPNEVPLTWAQALEMSRAVLS